MAHVSLLQIPGDSIKWPIHAADSCLPQYEIQGPMQRGATTEHKELQVVLLKGLWKCEKECVTKGTHVRCSVGET